MMLASFSIWPIIKILIIIIMVLYLIFSFVVVRQVQLMTDTLEVGFEKQLRLISFIHLLFAAATLIFSVIIL